MLSGKEEIIGDKELWGTLGGKNEIFKNNEGSYGAVSIIKRLWCAGSDSYLCRKLEIDENQFKKAVRYNSVQDVAKQNINDKSPYVAVIAMDGDEMGKWISGEKTPFLLDQLCGSAKKYFENLFAEDKLAKHKFAEKVRRPLSPGYHLQFSEALANFANHVAGKVVETFKGQLIYAGGDDVLAMLPADRAIDCVRALRSLFRGEENYGVFNKYSVPADGFIKIETDKSLMIPGSKADVSCGIAVAHYSHPLRPELRKAVPKKTMTAEPWRLQY